MGHGGSVPEAIKTVGFDPEFDGPLLELTDELWHESLEMYVLNVVRLARIVTPIMIEQGGGAFVNISSMNTIEPRAPYPMSMLRAALHSFSKLYGDRYARHNIRMNNLLPGFCENVNLSEFARKSIPAQRSATFEEIGQACVFLASEAARYINGQSILSDGRDEPGCSLGPSYFRKWCRCPQSEGRPSLTGPWRSSGLFPEKPS